MNHKMSPLEPEPRKDRLVWIDLEMTGLEPTNCVILEIATIVTDNNLTQAAEGPTLVIHQPHAVLDAMDEWNTTHHGQSGLIDRSKASKIDVGEAERQTLEFLAQYVEPRSAPLCGNTIGQDRRFLYPYMPRLSEFLHYRNIDVSSIKELVNRWYPEEWRAPVKRATHRALDDIRESIRELRFYREKIFVPVGPGETHLKAR